jgi:hypothetical protein
MSGTTVQKMRQDWRGLLEAPGLELQYKIKNGTEERRELGSLDTVGGQGGDGSIWGLRLG